MQSGFWQDMTTEDLAELDPERVIALLPLGAIEQHGPHLPLYTDTCINEGIVDRLLELIPDGVSLLVLPTLPVGNSCEHDGFPGTLSLAPETLMRMWTEVGESVARAGVRKLILFNSHGGQRQLVDLVALALRRRCRMLVVKANSFEVGVPAGLFEEAEMEHGIHAGAIETSIMLHLRPDLVRSERAECFVPSSVEMAERYERLGPRRPFGFAWLTEDLHPAGACGDASDADPERGRLIVDHVASELAILVQDMQRFPLSQLRDG